MNVFEVMGIDESQLNNKLYNGSEKKFGVTIDCVNYVMKFQKRNWNNIYCEYIASNIIKIFGGNVHETYLAKFKGETVVLCKDFCIGFEALKSFNVTESISLDTDVNKHDYYFDEVIYLLRNLHTESVDECIRDFKKMFLFDALLGNPDRHKGNWGLLRKSSGDYCFAPIFDNGADLFPRAVNVQINESWMKERIYTFPNSKVMFNNKRERSSYFEVLKNYELFKDVLTLFTEDKLELALVFIDNAPIPNDLKTLFKTVVYYRFHCILWQKPFVWEGTK